MQEHEKHCGCVFCIPLCVEDKGEKKRVLFGVEGRDGEVVLFFFCTFLSYLKRGKQKSRLFLSPLLSPALPFGLVPLSPKRGAFSFALSSVSVFHLFFVFAISLILRWCTPPRNLVVDVGTPAAESR